jgi:hypothetical protein
MRKAFVPVFVLIATLTISAQTPTPLDRAKQLQLEIGQLVDALTPATPAPLPVVQVPAGADVQAAINAATCGSTLALASGATYTGNYSLPNKTCGSAPIVLTTFGVLLPIGRVDPVSAAPFATLTSANTSAVIVTKAAAHDWKLIALHIHAGAGIYPFGLISIGAGDSTQTSLDQVPMHFLIDRCYIHGDPNTGAKRGIDMNGADVTVTNSYIADIKGKGQDTQALGGVNGPGPFVITNNYLEAAGENVLFGGADPNIPNLIPSDITITGNLISKPVAWRTQGWSVKNVLELKNAQRVTIANNVLEYSWLNGQVGYLLMITVRDQSGHCSWCTVQHVEVHHNVLRHGNQGINILGLDDDKDATGTVYPSVRASDLSIHDNLIYDIGGSTWGGGTTVGLIVNNGPSALTVTHNTWSGKTSEALAMTSGVSKTVAAGFQMTCNVLNEGSYGITGDGSTAVGAASWTANVDAASAFVGNQILSGGVRKITYPAGNTLAAYAFDGSYSAAPPLACADGKPAGADIAALLAATGADLSK